MLGAGPLVIRIRASRRQPHGLARGATLGRLFRPHARAEDASAHDDAATSAHGVKHTTETRGIFFVSNAISHHHHHHITQAKNMANQVIPESVRYAVGKMDFNSNCFRLLPNGAVTAGPNSRVLFTLPGNATIDLRSLVFSFDVTTTSDNTNGGGAVVYAKLPANSSSLIAQISVMASGVLISQSFSEYNTACKIKHIIHSSRDRDGSIDGTLHHGVISTTDAVDDVSVLFKPTLGLFGESSTRFLNTALCGDISVEWPLRPRRCWHTRSTAVRSIRILAMPTQKPTL